MGVSIVIPCLNEEKYINDCIMSLVNNGFSKSEMEILIVDGGSTDGTLPIVELLQKEHQFIKVVPNPHKKTPFALNIGIKNSANSYVLIAGAHAVYPKHYIEKLYNLIQKQGIDVVGGGIETKVKNRTHKTAAIKFVLSHRLGVGNSKFRVGANKMLEVDTVPFGMYKKEVFEKAGVYNEKLIRNHDIELSKRIKHSGFSIWMEPSLKVAYYARETYAGLAKNNYSNGFWNIKTLFITKRFKSLSFRHYVPMLFVLSLVVPLIFGFLVSKRFYFASLILISFYLFVVLLLSFTNSKKVHPLYLFFAFITLHFSYGAGSIMGLLPVFKFKKDR